jgi:hypothetical protein
MERKEKEERRKRWEQVIDLAEQREADMKAGKTPDGRRKGLSEEWIEGKEEVGENVRNAVRLAMLAQEADTNKNASGESSGSGGSVTASEEDSDGEDVMELDQADMVKLQAEAEAGDADAIWVLQKRLKIPSDLLPEVKPNVERRFVGFDDDDEYASSGDEVAMDLGKPKGKQKI